MTKEKTEYYSLDEINKHTDCRYKIIYGMRANGKSYAVKSHALKEAWGKKAMTFAIIRRMDSDIKTELVESYFADMNPYIKKLTKNEFNCISVYRGRIFFAKQDDDGNIERGFCCGKAFALSLDERYKSGAYPDITTIIYEEFITNRLYLKNETVRLMGLVSTILRRRQGNVYLVGNTISRQNPYFFDWSLKGIRTQQAGTIDIYTYKAESGEVKIAVEFCGDGGAAKSGMFFGNASKSIDGTAWETKEYQHLEADFEEYNLLYSLQLINSDYKFNICLLQRDEESPIVYIYPASFITSDRILQEGFSSDIMVTNRLNKNNRAEVLIGELWQKNKVCYSHNLCGEDFNQSLKMMTAPLSIG